MSEKIKLLGLDLDGTLLNSKKQLARLDEDKIRETMEKGVIVVPITGRPKKGIFDTIHNLFQCSYIITSNGAVTTDVQFQKDIDGNYMDTETVAKVLKEIENQSEVQIEIFADGMGYVQNNHLTIIKEKYRGTPLESYIFNSRIPVNDINGFVAGRNNNIAGISIMTESVSTRRNIQELLHEFEQIRITSNAPTDLEINAAEAGKGQALLNLAKRLGIEPSEIMVCGDGGNDVDMIQMAGLGIAMGNAGENVKKIADYVTLSNEENGVAFAIDKFILNG